MSDGECVLLDVPVYEDILSGIEFENDMCKYDDTVVESIEPTVGTDTGILLKEYLGLMCDTTSNLRKHVGVELLDSLNAIKKSIVTADKEAAESLAARGR